jgi:hypothetical protein
MADLEDIHAERTRVARQRQPRWSSELDEFDRTLGTLGLDHPYRLALTEVAALLSHAWFARGGSGLPAMVSRGDYLYRISPTEAILAHTSDWNESPKPHADEFFFSVEVEAARTKAWVPLQRFARGDLRGWRNMTWWTALQLEPTDLVAQAQLLGLYTVSDTTMVLRCPTPAISGLGTLRVPTVLDGSPHEVFHPTGDLANPTSGMTVDLREDRFVDGVPEYVLPQLPVDLIEMLPVRTANQKRTRRQISSNEATWQLLLTYYAGL